MLSDKSTADNPSSPISELHFHLYENGNVGMCNVLMSVELALTIGYLTGRTTTAYAQLPLYNSTNNFFIDDLFDIDDITIVREPITIAATNLPDSLQETCITNGRIPSQAFLCGRSKIIDLRDFNDVKILQTADHKTLGFYSYLFCLSGSEQYRVHNYLQRSIRPKKKYADLAQKVVSDLHREFKKFNSITVRRGDYLRVGGTRGALITTTHYLDVLLANLPTDEVLLIHSDEEDEAYFLDIKRRYAKVVFIDTHLSQLFEDKAELGLVSMLIASYSNNFIGTMYSTFSEMIRRCRMQNGLTEQFIYLYSHSDEVPLRNGQMVEETPGENRWNRITMPREMLPMNFWWREWFEMPDALATSDH